MENVHTLFILVIILGSLLFIGGIGFGLTIRHFTVKSKKHKIDLEAKFSRQEHINKRFKQIHEVNHKPLTDKLFKQKPVEKIEEEEMFLGL